MPTSAGTRDLETQVLAPLRQTIDTLRREQATPGQQGPEIKGSCEATAGSLGSRRREIQAEIRRLRKSVSDATSVATRIRCEIDAWRFPETADWKDWLAEQPLFDDWSRLDEDGPPPRTLKEWIAIESEYRPRVDDGVRVNIAPLQRGGLLAAPVLAAKDVERAIADRARWPTGGSSGGGSNGGGSNGGGRGHPT